MKYIKTLLLALSILVFNTHLQGGKTITLTVLPLPANHYAFLSISFLPRSLFVPPAGKVFKYTLSPLKDFKFSTHAIITRQDCIPCPYNCSDPENLEIAAKPSKNVEPSKKDEVAKSL